MHANAILFWQALVKQIHQQGLPPADSTPEIQAPLGIHLRRLASQQASEQACRLPISTAEPLIKLIEQLHHLFLSRIRAVSGFQQ
jgi:hypothetical protein